ncbi:J domain-containing protein, partial [Escherichia coli]|uniref:J domain-containing protein n=1 Tax=Escherichia coli TaxID=562 RepID=UPI0013D1F28B
RLVSSIALAMGSVPHPTEQAFSELGLTQSASLDNVRSAYRERVKEVHPDHGGNEDEFKRLE